MSDLAVQINAEGVIPVSGKEAYTSDIGKFEKLPKWLNCVPLVVQWIFLSLRYRSLTLPSAANPGITCGGMVGEGKLEYFNAMGSLARSVTADFVFLTVYGMDSQAQALACMKAGSLSFPVVAKPDLGWCGYGVRRLNTEEDLKTYLSLFPIGQKLILQQFIPDEGEAGIFYVRYPGEEKGHLVGILLRYFPRVVGNGHSTVSELMALDPRLKRLDRTDLHKVNYDPDRIPALGEMVRLATIGSTRVGGLYCDGTHLITPELTARIDKISRDMGEFHIGRFDMRYKNIDELRQGNGLTIMEVNGAGSEAVQAWDPKYTIREAYNIIFAKQNLLFKVGAEARKRGHYSIGIRELARLHFHQQRLIKLYPPSN